MFQSSKQHLAEVQEGYFEHLRAALRIALLMSRAGASCAVHAIIPGLFSRTASRCLAEVQTVFAERAAHKAQASAPVGRPALAREDSRLSQRDPQFFSS